MVIVDDVNNNFDDFTLVRTVSMGSNRIYSPEYTNILKSTKTGMIIGYHVTNM
jgi:hypothetical protein